MQDNGAIAILALRPTADFFYVQTYDSCSPTGPDEDMQFISNGIIQPLIKAKPLSSACPVISDHQTLVLANPSVGCSATSAVSYPIGKGVSCLVG